MSTTPLHDAHPLQHSASVEREAEPTHFLLVGYALWIFGFLGAHRFYYGRPITGTIWLLTLGLLFVGWFIDLFLMPSLQASVQRRSVPGPVNHTIAWLLLTFLGWLGAHRFYQRKWVTGALYAVSGGIFGLGIIYDFWTLNEQIDEINLSSY
ncbi:TM2 domain-containing protein [Botrimarina sp.]|uniref:TM2 domain-containing protein n=1 Tax=Botrimarina sp. TaxID=2795802 RepID=UPI0032EC3224